MEYKIHGTTIFIKGNNVIGHYKVQDNKVFKIVDVDGEDFVEDFHTLGEIALNSEAKLLNELREKGEI